MLRGIFYLTLLGVAFGQTPIEVAIQGHDKARNEGRFADASSYREEALRLLNSASAEAPQFRNWTLQVAMLYGNLGYTERARSVLTSSLARMSHPSAELLGAMADLWHQDGNLLASLKYREQAAAAPPAPEIGNGAGSIMVVSGLKWFTRAGAGDSKIYQQQRLAELYLELGRRDAASAITGQIASPFEMAELYEREGSIDRAIAIYQQTLAGGDVNLIPAAADSLSRIYRDQHKNAESIAVLEKALASVARKPQALALRESLAVALQAAGRPEASEEIYRSLMRENPDDFGIVSMYANQAPDPKQAEAAVLAYRDSHPKMEWWEQNNILTSLAFLAGRQGDTKRAQELHRLVEETQRAHVEPPPAQVSIAAELQKANTAANAGRLDEAVEFATQALNLSARAFDRQQLLWTVPAIAVRAVSNALEFRLLEEVRSWDDPNSLLTALENYARSLMQDPKRSAEIPAVIEQIKTTAIASHGANSDPAARALRVRGDWERSRRSWQAGLDTAKDLVDFEKSIAGDSSEPYLNAIEGLAQSYAAIGDRGRELDTLRQAIALADRLHVPPSFREGSLRMNAAMALAALGKFDEAEQLASEAIAIGEKLHQPQHFAGQMAQIQRMKSNRR